MGPGLWRGKVFGELIADPATGSRGQRVAAFSEPCSNQWLKRKKYPCLLFAQRISLTKILPFFRIRIFSSQDSDFASGELWKTSRRNVCVGGVVWQADENTFAPPRVGIGVQTLQAYRHKWPSCSLEELRRRLVSTVFNLSWR